MIPQEYVLARSVLLDALEGLGAHRAAAVLVGAQAVYLHCGDADLRTAPTTTDGDLALAPDRLMDAPPIEDAMRQAGFVSGDQPGTWWGRGRIAVDLMVPEALSGLGGRRGARLPSPHGNKATRRTLGLEPAIVDNEVWSIGALDGSDARSFPIKVAGPAALIVSKIIKIAERRGQPHRLKPKDGLDVLRLLRTADITQLARRLHVLSQDDLSKSVVELAMQEMSVFAAGVDGVLPTLAAKAEEGFDDPDVIRMSMVVLVHDLMRELSAVGTERAAAGLGVGNE